MENDANVFGLGESWTGAARGVRNWVGITLGTGTGGCLFLNGKLWEGDDLGFSAEIGHMIVEPGGPVCPCGSKGCLEAFASARALVSGARRAVREQKLKEGPLHALEREGKLSAQTIYACAKRGDPTALALFDKMGWALGICLANIFSALGIRRAVIGGGVSPAWDLFIGPLEKALAQNCSMLDPGLALVMQSRLGNDAALIGAARARPRGRRGREQLMQPSAEIQGNDFARNACFKRFPIRLRRTNPRQKGKGSLCQGSRYSFLYRQFPPP